MTKKELDNLNVGEYFISGNQKFKIIESDSCGECSFRFMGCGNKFMHEEVIPLCRKNKRKDKKNVIFKEVFSIWKCKKCGKEIKAKVMVKGSLIYNLSENGDIDSLSKGEIAYLNNIKSENLNYYVEKYFCSNCNNEAERLKDIATWEESYDK